MKCCFADQTSSATLDVEDPPAWFVTELQAVECTERDDITMECELSRPNVDVCLTFTVQSFSQRFFNATKNEFKCFSSG